MANQMKDPPWPERHLPPVLEDWIGDLWDWLRLNRPLEGVGVEITDTGSGLAISVKPPTSIPRRPLQPFDASANTTPKIGVTPGRFGENAEKNPGDSIPTISGTKIDHNPAPHLTVDQNDIFAYLKVIVDDTGKITGVEVHSGASIPTDGDETKTYVLLCSLKVTVSGGTALVVCGVPNLSGSQGYTLCGGVDHEYWLI